MKRAIVIILLIVLLGVVALEAAVMINIFRARQNLNTIGITKNID